MRLKFLRPTNKLLEGAHFGQYSIAFRACGAYNVFSEHTTVLHVNRHLLRQAILPAEMSTSLVAAASLPNRASAAAALLCSFPCVELKQLISGSRSPAMVVDLNEHNSNTASIGCSVLSS